MFAHPIGIMPPELIDQAAQDALSLEARGYTSAHEEYSVGRWATAPLSGGPSGEAAGEAIEHDEPARPIASTESLTGINDH